MESRPREDMDRRTLSDADIAAASERLAGETPQVILSWAAETFGQKLTMATAFGAEGCCLIHMLAEVAPWMRIFNLDTGYQFQETLDVRTRIRERYGIDVELVQPEMTVAEYEEEHGGPLYRIRPDQCCHDRKMVPLRRAVEGYEAWISAIRSDQTSDRRRAAVVGWDAKFNLVKVNPLLGWTKKDVWAFVMKHDVPYNVLHDRGYPSVGCWPCTQPVADGQDERAGRWAGTVKKECGLHVIEVQDGGGI
jgi:phosphoadenosine phosphosulfate reductase